MAFIKEWLKEEDWELYNSFELYYENRRCLANQNCGWTVDKERDIYFIFLGGGGLDVPREYAIIWEGKKIWMMTESEAVKERSSGQISSHWKIETIRAEKSLEVKREEIVTLVKELLNFQRSNLVIDQMAEPVFVEEGRVF